MLFLVHGAANTRLRFGGVERERASSQRCVSQAKTCAPVWRGRRGRPRCWRCGGMAACSDEPSRFRGFWRARARPAEEDGRGVPWGCRAAEQYQFSAATPTADTCFSGIPVGGFPRVEAGSVAHIGINDEVFSMEPHSSCATWTEDTRFVFISAQPARAASATIDVARIA
jgi:hypothetical protein